MSESDAKSNEAAGQGQPPQLPDWAVRPCPLSELSERVSLLLHAASMAASPADRFRFAMGALYFARAIAQHIVDAAQDGDLGEPVATVIAEMRSKVRRYKLIDDVRVHDFHRAALIPPNPALNQAFLQGPFRFTARQGGVAAMVGFGEDRQTIKTKNSSVSQDRPIKYSNGLVFDAERKEWIQVDAAVKEYMADIASFVEWYRNRV